MRKWVAVVVAMLLLTSAGTASADSEEEIYRRYGDEIAITARMAERCASSLGGGYFNTARDRCMRFVEAYGQVIPEIQDAMQNVHKMDGGIPEFCMRDSELTKICSDIGIMVDAFQKVVAANKLGAFD